MNTEFLFFILLTFTSQVIAKNVDQVQKCKPGICGPNSRCIDNEDDSIYNKLKQPYCLCDPKTIGKPPNCTIGCLKNSDCEADEYCENKKCVKVCEHTCNSTKSCHDAKKICVGRCRDHDDCKAEEICDIRHNCVAGCRSDSSCNDNEYCNDDSKCVNVCFKSNCGENSICSGYNHIQHCACEEGYIPEKGIGCTLKETNHTFIELDEIECHHYCGEFASCIFEDDIIHCYCPKDLRNNPIVACPPPLLSITEQPEYCECCDQAIDPDCAVPISCAMDAECVVDDFFKLQ